MEQESSFEMARRRMRNWRFRYIYIFILLIPVHFIFDYFGIYLMARSESFSEFKYPHEVDMPKLVAAFERGKKPWVGPLNRLIHPEVSNAEDKCLNGVFGDLHVVLVIKSAMNHFENRNMIRRTWGLEMNDLGFRTRRVFVVGVDPLNQELQQQIHEENVAFHDIVQYFFKDSYWNNTIKTMLAFKWVEQYCSNAKYAFFLDDDYYVSNRNLKKFIHTVPESKRKNFIAGYIWTYARPLRQKNSKWYVTLEEYPYFYWPPYPTAGSYLVTMETIHKFNIAMLYTKYTRFDDVFIGIVAWKLGIRLTHSEHMHYYNVPYTKEAYRDTIAMHEVLGMDLWKIWNEQEKLIS
ncbi:unnamed protein product [Owenia fusiformis]|uniref:Hexosyltransferase n=1 Tax=Owenia fusiformis TaxID=6347 RepID=A0A8J1UZE5_OWEFU|nr:unnamed protein product [Owenia fusiformis]